MNDRWVLRTASIAPRMRASVRILGLAALACAPAMAHHSFSAYDMTKSLKVAGTIKIFRWGAPHSSVVLVTKDDKGNVTEMAVLSGSPAAFSRQGLVPRDFHPGDKVTVVYHPHANGNPGGVMASLILPNGKGYTEAESTVGGGGAEVKAGGAQ